MSIRHILVAGPPPPAQTIGAMLAQGVLALSLIVRLYDAYGVPQEQLAAARTAVERILKEAGVAVTWRPCPCAEPMDASELVIRVVAASPASDPLRLGFSYVDVERRAGTLATVFEDRVVTLEAFAGIEAGELLGRAMAHEIGHLLLGTTEHERSGLMRGRWTAGELAARRTVDWVLSRRDGAKIRQAIVRRTRESLKPVMVVAGPESVEEAVSEP